MKEVLLLSFVAVLFAVLFSFPVNFLSRKMRRSFGVLLTLLIFIGLVGGLGVLTVPVLSEQGQSIASRLPDAVDQIQKWFKKVKTSAPVAQLPAGDKIADKLNNRAGGLIETLFKGLFPAAKGILGFLSAVVFIFILAIFLVGNPNAYREGMRKLFPQPRQEVFDESYQRLSHGLRNWVGGILAAMTLMGTFTAIGLAIAGIENWPLLAIITFFGTFVPYLGAIASAVPGLLIALSQSPQKFFYALLVYIGAHILEGYILEPLIMRRAVEIKPAVLLVGQAVLLTLFGVLGVIVAAPLIACMQILIQYLYVERSLAMDTDQPNRKAA